MHVLAALLLVKPQSLSRPLRQQIWAGLACRRLAAPALLPSEQHSSSPPRLLRPACTPTSRMAALLGAAATAGASRSSASRLSAPPRPRVPAPAPVFGRVCRPLRAVPPDAGATSERPQPAAATDAAALNNCVPLDALSLAQPAGADAAAPAAAAPGDAAGSSSSQEAAIAVAVASAALAALAVPPPPPRGIDSLASFEEEEGLVEGHAEVQHPFGGSGLSSVDELEGALGEMVHDAFQEE